jgi:zinc D-Ala-D-Ala dipeptidase
MRHAQGYVLMFKDCYRPASVQLKMWDVVKGTPMAPYVADPHSKTGSVHNYGAAVDITLIDAQGKEVDMGTPHDFLGELAEPRLEERFLQEGKLTAEQIKNRRILRAAMVDGGKFLQLDFEWWHYDALRGDALRATYQKLDVPLTAVLSASASPK